MRWKLSIWCLLALAVILSLISTRCSGYQQRRLPIRFKSRLDTEEVKGTLLRMSEDRRDDIALEIWKQAKSALPPIITGDYTGQRGDNSPLAALYNMLFVRIPTIMAGLVYASKLNNSSWALVCDLGFGQFEVPPTLVALAMLIILS